MFTVSAFADEISPDPQVQVDVLRGCGIRHIEFRSILGTNVLNLTDHQLDEFKSLLDRHGFKLSAVGSPIGKIRIDEPFEPHLAKLRRAIEVAQLFDTPNIRIFSYYPPQDGADPGGELARGERLHDVVVGAEVEAADAVLFHAPAGEHDHRQLALAAQGGQHVETVEVGQVEVEQDDVRGV